MSVCVGYPIGIARQVAVEENPHCPTFRMHGHRGGAPLHSLLGAAAHVAGGA